MILVFLLLSLASATTEAHSRGNEIDSVNDGILKVLTDQATAWNNGDIEGYMEGYWKSDSLLFTSGGRMQKGWKATMEKYKAAYATRTMMGTLEFSSIEVHHLSSGSAWVFGRWQLQRKPEPAGGVFTLVLRLFADGWKIVHDHTSVDPPSDPKQEH